MKKTAPAQRANEDVAQIPAEEAVDGDGAAAARLVQEPRLWQDDGWTARVIKNEDDEGWAVEIFKDGVQEPALVAPWTMGRDKKNPKPLDANAFHTWIKTAAEVVGRHAQQMRARLHKSERIMVGTDPVDIELDIVPDDDDPHAWLTATDAFGERLARVKVEQSFKLTARSAEEWARGGYRRLG